jgi:hypothetical protein
MYVKLGFKLNILRNMYTTYPVRMQMRSINYIQKQRLRRSSVLLFSLRNQTVRLRKANCRRNVPTHSAVTRNSFMSSFHSLLCI